MQGIMSRASESCRGTQTALRGGNLRQSETVVDLAEIGWQFLGRKYRSLLLDSLLHEGRGWYRSQVWGFRWTYNSTVIASVRACLDYERVFIEISYSRPHDSLLETESWSLFHRIPLLRGSRKFKWLYLFLLRRVVGVWLGQICATTISSWGCFNRFSIIIYGPAFGRETCLSLLWLTPDNVEAWHGRRRCNVLDWRCGAGLTLVRAIWDEAPMLSY